MIAKKIKIIIKSTSIEIFFEFNISNVKKC